MSPAGSSARPATRPRPRDDLRALEGYHSPQLDAAVRLNTNESPYAPPREFVEEWLARLRGLALHRYPDRGAHELRAALGASLDQDPERLFCANGSNEVLQTLLLTYGGPGRRALVLEPTYALHGHIARITATEVVEGERAADYTVDVATTAELVRGLEPDLVLLCSPNNPTGTVERLDAVGALAQLAAEQGALLVVDEAYGEFAPHTALALVDDRRPLVVVRTYSKVWSMAALRLGYLVGPTWVVEELEKVVLPYSLSAPTQIAGVLALEHLEEMRQRVEALVAERERLATGLRDQPGVTPVPSGANFVLFRVAGGGQACWDALVRRGVLVRSFARWPRLDDCLRVTVGTPEENDAFLAALGEAVQEVEA